jgi:hypothetical protein
LLKEPSDILRLARRQAETTLGIELLDDFRWFHEEQLWALKCRILINVSSAFVPSESDWFFLIPEVYPRGEIKVMPSKSRSINVTFPHQSPNDAGPENIPWREGKLCLDRPTHIFGKGWDDENQRTAEGKLHWTMSRAVEWVQLAANNNLLAPGDPFELPVLPPLQTKSQSEQTSVVVFYEDELSFRKWQEILETHGIADIRNNNSCKKYKGIVSFETAPLAHEVIPTPPWGMKAFSSTPGVNGLWLRLPNLPIIPPWELPRNWGQIKTFLGEKAWRFFLPMLKDSACSLKKTKLTYLLLGCPIPEKVSGIHLRIHWLAIKLPQYDWQGKGKSLIPNNLRPASRWSHFEREFLSDKSPVEWVETENWAPDQIATRGRFKSPLKDLSFAVIGLGAMGAPIAELLARCGIRKMFLIDGDVLEIGNLVRHTLTMDDLSFNKANALKDKIMQISPHIDVKACNTRFENMSVMDKNIFIKDANVIIDCTSDDDILDQLVSDKAITEQILFSCSVNYGAKRLFLYSGTKETFIPSSFKETIAPFIKEDYNRYVEDDCPMQGIGCWHPVFPARADDFSIFSGIVLKYIEKCICDKSHQWGTTIYEQVDGEGFYCGVKKVYP